jgi:hypothetical protein
VAPGIASPIGKVTDEAPALGAVPPQVVLRDPPTIVRPLGKVSTKFEVRLLAVVLLLLNVMLRSASPPGLSAVVGKKALLSATPPGSGGTTTGAVRRVLQPPIVLPPTDIVTTPVVVTAPASKLPDTLLALDTVMLVSAMMVPMKESPLSAADEPTRQYTLHGFAVPVTVELPFMVSELATLKTKIPVPVGSLSVRFVEAAKSPAPNE